MPSGLPSGGKKGPRRPRFPQWRSCFADERSHGRVRAHLRGSTSSREWTPASKPCVPRSSARYSCPASLLLSGGSVVFHTVDAPALGEQEVRASRRSVDAPHPPSSRRSTDDLGARKSSAGAGSRAPSSRLLAIRTLSVRDHPSRCRPARRWNTAVRATPGLASASSADRTTSACASGRPGGASVSCAGAPAGPTTCPSAAPARESGASVVSSP